MKTVIIETVKKSNEDRRISGVADFATKQDIENAVKDTREDIDKAIKKTLGDDNQVLKNIMTAIETAGNTVSSMENSYLKPIKESTDETKKSIDKINNIDDRTRKTEETINNII
jgi:acyl-CoA reductase-like NAD-dependent aldehyde dehydrogenase